MPTVSYQNVMHFIFGQNGGKEVMTSDSQKKYICFVDIDMSDSIQHKFLASCHICIIITVQVWIQVWTQVCSNLYNIDLACRPTYVIKQDITVGSLNNLFNARNK